MAHSRLGINVQEAQIEQQAKMTKPLISCLCVTEGRPAFMPWLMWCFDRQSWPQRELLIVDSSVEPFQPMGRADVRVVAVPPGTNVPRKRNVALREAKGEFVAWFDDDDWQHPERLVSLMDALGGGAIYAGVRQAWFVNLSTRQCEAYPGFKSQVIFNSALFRREHVQNIRFQEHFRHASDTPWMTALRAAHPGKIISLDRQDLFFWLCHSTNLSNPIRRHRFGQPLHLLKNIVGDESWGDTDAALQDLQSRLAKDLPVQTAATSPRRKTIMVKKHNSFPPISQAGATPFQDGKKENILPSIGVVIKATLLDAAYLNTMVRHMLAQARHEFSERVIVVDRRVNFSGKYRSRPRLEQNDLDQVLDQLLTDKVIDAVRDVDMRPSHVKGIMEQYFRDDADRVPTHAATGGPIYATLFGLESMKCDYVLQMDSDILFHSGLGSWVSKAFDYLSEDPRLWLMMTHPGPPAGPLGRSLVGQNAKSASWDPQRKLWQFRHATTRYFLCDRRRLYGRLRPIFQAGGCVPLEQCISQAMQREGGLRGALGDLESWHMHAWYHGDPFPQWASAIARLVEDGQYPGIQRGNYDLRLDYGPTRRQWAPLVAALQSDGNGVSNHLPAQQQHVQLAMAHTKDTTVQLENTAAFAVVIPVRDRAGQRLRNSLVSLNWQTGAKPAQILVVSHGSQPEIDRELAVICAEQRAALIRVGTPNQPWNKPFALNTGIRATSAEIPFVMTMDVDMILAPNFLEVVHRRLADKEKNLVLCRISDLDKNVTLPASGNELLSKFYHFRAHTKLRSPTGSGGIQAAARSFFFKIRGYDEDLLWWGAMDGDILQRARCLNMIPIWIESETVMLHQWHPRKYQVLRDRQEIEQARQYWVQNHQLVTSRRQNPYRNPNGWGGVTD
jgi:glycosyltransferase involved in cell wall biosynthesis